MIFEMSFISFRSITSVKRLFACGNSFWARVVVGKGHGEGTDSWHNYITEATHLQ